MTTRREPSRRALLATGFAGAGALALAACGGSGNSPLSGGSTAAGEPADPHSSGGAGTTRPQAGAGTGTRAPSGAAARSGTALVPLRKITVGEAVAVTLPDGSPAVVARPSARTAACFSAVCTHMGCTVEPAGTQLHCPCHGSVYDATTGEVVHGPAPRPLPAIAVHVADGEVRTDR